MGGTLFSLASEEICPRTGRSATPAAELVGRLPIKRAESWNEERDAGLEKSEGLTRRGPSGLEALWMLLLRSCHSDFASFRAVAGVEIGVEEGGGRDDVEEDSDKDGWEEDGWEAWAAPDPNDPSDETRAGPEVVTLGTSSVLSEAL